MKKILIFSFVSFLGIVYTLKLGVNAAEYMTYQGRGENVDNYTTIIETKDQDPNDPDVSILESSEVDGGWWRRGKDGGFLISEYKHYTKQGRASCENPYGYCDGRFQAPNTWSYSRLKWCPTGGNKAYYDFR